MIVVNGINIFKILGEQTYKVGMFSYCLSGKFEVVLSQIEAVDIGMSATNIIRFAFILLLKKKIVEYDYIFIFRI